MAHTDRAPRRRLGLAASLLLTVTILPMLPPAGPPRVAAATAVASERLGGADRYTVSVAVSKRLLPNGHAPLVYLASGATFPDALAAGPAAAKAGGAVLLTAQASLPAAVEAELVRLAPPRVVVAGGTGSVSDAVLNRVKTVLPAATVERIGGATRYDVAAGISARTYAAGSVTSLFVASGESFPDALAAGPASARNNMPVLLTRHDYLPAATAAEIRRLHPTKVVVLGGTGSVPAAVVSAITALGPSVERIGGATRYDVAAAIAKRYFPTAPTIVAASGESFPDALSAVPLAASLGAPIVTLEFDALPTPIRDYVRSAPRTRVVIAGGPASISEIDRGELIGWSGGAFALPPAHPTYPAYDSRYHDYYEMLEYIRSAQLARPDLVQVFSIGKTYQGRDIWAAKISDNVATDEAEPEVLIDALHHAREHLGVEQALYVLRTLVNDYTTDATVKRLVDSREVFIVFAINVDGWFFDLSGAGSYAYANWRKNRQPNTPSAYIGTDLNRNYGYKWGCCGGSSSATSAWNYRGSAAWSATETRVMRDFVLSRVVGGKQQIRTHVTLHTNGELILYPYGYTKTVIPADMTADDHAVFVEMARKMAASNGYKPLLSSWDYVTDGDQIDWMYGTQKVFSFTFELYPTEQVSSRADHEPPDEAIAPQTARNRGALLFLIDAAGCPWAQIGKQATYCPAA